MVRTLGAILRVIIGFVAACLVAGAIQVLFAVTPTELIVAGEQRWNEALAWSLLTATQTAVFAWPFALIAAIVSEWQTLRSFAYHALVGIAIATAAFGLLVATEGPDQPTIVNSYAMATYLTTGFAAGLAYWLVAGRWALRHEPEVVRMEASPITVVPRSTVASTTVPVTRPGAPTPAAPPSTTVPLTGQGRSPSSQAGGGALPAKPPAPQGST